MTQFTCKGVKQTITGYHLNTFTIRISLRFSSAREFQMGNFQKYWSQNVGQDFIVLDFLCWGEIVREINVSRAGDKALTRETPVQVWHPEVSNVWKPSWKGKQLLIKNRFFTSSKFLKVHFTFCFCLRSLGHFPFSTLRREILTSLPLIWCTHLQGSISS